MYKYGKYFISRKLYDSSQKELSFLEYSFIVKLLLLRNKLVGPTVDQPLKQLNEPRITIEERSKVMEGRCAMRIANYKLLNANC